MSTSVMTMTKPSYDRNGVNTGAADITRGKILTRSGSYPGVALATAATDLFCGVSLETMEGTTAGAITRSYQNGGIAMVTSGAAFARGVELTSDAQGRAIAATAGTQCIIGVSEEAATAADEDIPVEIAIRRSLEADA